MIKMIKTSLAFLLCTILLVGCSGGGGSNSATGQTVTTVTGSTTPGTSNSVLGTVTLTKTALQLNEATTASATFTKADGTAAAGIQVFFTTTTGTLSPASGTVTADSNGTASIQITAGSTSGSAQITASATVDNQQVSKTALFSVNLPTLQLANLAFVNNSNATIDYGSTIGVTVDVTDTNGALYTDLPVSVTFTSTNVASGKATISSPVQTVDGKASSTYTALTAVGSDTITATIAGSAKTINLTVNSLNAGSLSYVSASPTNIGLKGMGGLGYQETSKVTFKVVDTSGAAKTNQPVTFSLNTYVGGLTLTQTSGSTSSDGTVSTYVQSGTIATPVRVTASTVVNGTTLSTQSDQLVISTGIPAQDGISVSVGNLNSESWDYDGVYNPITVRLSDHFRNPPPDGTAVYFTTEGGNIEPFCTTGSINSGATAASVCPAVAEKGMCCVVWKSQAPRPTDGRVTILAYAIGEEAFLDLNGNGLADAGEFTDDSEAFRNDDFDGGRDSTETFIDFNSDGAFNGPDGKYNGVLQGTAYVSAPKSKHVFSNTTIVMSGSTPATVTFAPGSATIGATTILTLTVSDVNGNPMPSGTTILVNAASAPSIAMVASTFTVPQAISGGPNVTTFQVPITVSATATPSTSEPLTVTITVDGKVTIYNKLITFL